MTLHTFDPDAGTKLLEAESEYHHYAGRHFEEGRWHVSFQAPDNVGRIYAHHQMRVRRILYTHFQDAAQQEACLTNYDMGGLGLPDAENNHNALVRTMALDKMRRIHVDFIPDMSIEHDPFAKADNAMIDAKMVTFENTNGPHHTNTLMTLKRVNNGFMGKKEAAVCFTHLPGGVGRSPMNAIEQMAGQLLKSDLKGHKLENVRFFIHVPPDIGVGIDEMFIEHYLEKRGGRIVIADRNHFDAKPACLDEIIYKHFQKPDQIESAVEGTFHMDEVDAKQQGLYHKISSLEDTHAAQTHRRFVLAARTPTAF